jgi:EamA domain-containing membrane protein RarD
LKNQVEDYDDNNNNDNNNNFSLRDMMTSSFTSLLTVTSAATSVTATSIIMPQNAASTIRINQYPPLKYLEPIYELKLSIQALQQGITNPNKCPLIQK